LAQNFTLAATTCVRRSIPSTERHVPNADRSVRLPVQARVVHDRNGQLVEQTQFFVRVANGTRALEDDEQQK
jgi:hypothetical protein